MKKYIKILSLVVGGFLFAGAAYGAISQTVPVPTTAGYLLQASSTAVGSSTWVAASSFAVTTTTGNWIGTVQGKTLGTISTYASTDYLASSTSYVSTTTGNWLGTWKGYTSTDFLASSTSYLTTSTNFGSAQWLGYYATSTTNWDDPFFFMNTTSTVKKVILGVKDGSASINIGYGTSQTAASSTQFKLWSSDVSLTATTTPVCYAVATTTACPNSITASSTPGINNVLRFFASSASTTALTATVYYNEN